MLFQTMLQQVFSCSLRPRFPGQGEIQVIAQSRSFTAFISVTPEKGVKSYGICVERNREHIRTLIKDTLGPVAMMQVNIKYRNTPEIFTQTLCSNSRIVQITEPPGHV